MNKRYKSVIKFYNFIRSNKLAPLKIKLKVLRSCVLGSLLYNCETFGPLIPKQLDSTYLKLLKCCLGVRSNTPNDIVYVESGFLPLNSLILIRQFKFYKRFFDTIASGSRRERMMNFLLQDEKRTNFIQHYETLTTRYSSPQEIVEECRDQLKQRIRNRAGTGQYKFEIYTRVNPDLSTSPFINSIHPISHLLVRFRLGSHQLPIETGRWIRRPRHERLCTACGELGDEEHVIFSCSLVRRDDLSLVGSLNDIWGNPDIFHLFKRLRSADLV